MAIDDVVLALVGDMFGQCPEPAPAKTDAGPVQRVSFLPTDIDNQSQPTPVSPGEGSESIQELEQMSTAFEPRFRVEGEEVVVA